jgi:hypothetical protein
LVSKWKWIPYLALSKDFFQTPQWKAAVNVRLRTPGDGGEPNPRAAIFRGGHHLSQRTRHELNQIKSTTAQSIGRVIAAPALHNSDVANGGITGNKKMSRTRAIGSMNQTRAM